MAVVPWLSMVAWLHGCCCGKGERADRCRALEPVAKAPLVLTKNLWCAGGSFPARENTQILRPDRDSPEDVASGAEELD